MYTVEEHRLNPDLRAMVVEASLALARLDADQLEELALSCQALNRALVSLNGDRRAELAHQAQNSAGEMAVFGRVLDATRANLEVMRRIRELREAQLEYGSGAQGSQSAGQGYWALTERSHGND